MVCRAAFHARCLPLSVQLYYLCLLEAILEKSDTCRCKWQENITAISANTSFLPDLFRFRLNGLMRVNNIKSMLFHLTLSSVEWVNEMNRRHARWWPDRGKPHISKCSFPNSEVGREGTCGTHTVSYTSSTDRQLPCQPNMLTSHLLTTNTKAIGQSWVTAYSISLIQFMNLDWTCRARTNNLWAAEDSSPTHSVTW